MKHIDFRTFFMAVVLLVALTACQAAGAAGNGPNGQWAGFLEGDKVDVAPEVGGRITNIAVQEGDSVQAGQPLATLEDDLIRLRISSADADVAAAQAQLALLEAGARPEDIRSAEAKVSQARAAVVAASQAVTDTEAIRTNPQMLLIGKAQAEFRAQAATQQLEAAKHQAAAADLIKRMWQEQVRMMEEGVDVTLPGGATRHFDVSANKLAAVRGEWEKAGTASWQAWAAVGQAQANYDAAQAGLKDISDQLTNPIALDTKVDQARAARDRASASVQAVEAGLQALEDGPSAAQIQAARASLDQARAARAALDQEQGHYEIKAPSSGTVSQVFYRSGEVILPTTPVVRLSVPGNLTLRVFVPMSALSAVHVGQSVGIQAEGISDRSFSGVVKRVADRAEFTGRQAQTDSELNAQLVAVEITVQDAGGSLKAGMPANVSFK